MRFASPDEGAPSVHPESAAAVFAPGVAHVAYALSAAKALAGRRSRFSNRRHQLAEAPAAEKVRRSIVPFLKVPADPSQKPYLVGSRCKQCGATYLGTRMACSRCFSTDQMDEVKLSDKGELHVFSIVHQSAPGVPTPYVAAIVDLPEGVSVRCNIEGVEPDPQKLKFGMPVQMVTEKIRTDREGNDVIAFSFRPV